MSRSYTSLPETVQEEYFWICPECADSWTLQLDEEGRVVTTGIVREADEPMMPVISRSDGMLLRSVSSVRSRLR